MKRIYLEITNACNLACPFCTNKKGNSFMPIEKIDNYLEQIKEISKYIYLHVLGEPLLHKDFSYILKLLDDKKINLQLVTNGILLYKYPHLLEHDCIRKLSISLHSINNLQVNDNYFKTIKRIIKDNKKKIIELRFYDQNNLSQKLISFLNELKEEYSFKILNQYNSYKLKDNIYIVSQKMFNWPKLSDPYIGNKGKCHGIKDQIAILHNGMVTTCCLDAVGKNVFGDLNVSSLKEILESSLYKKALKSLNENKLTFPLCMHCDYRLRFNK